MAEYKIIIQNETQQDVGNETLPQSQTVQTPTGQVLEIKESSGITPTVPTKNGGIKAKQLAVGALGAYTASQAFSFVSSNITEWTGSNKASRQIELGTKALGYATALALNPALGLLTIGFDVGSNIYSYNKDQFYKNLEASAVRERSGRQIFGNNGRNKNYKR